MGIYIAFDIVKEKSYFVWFNILNFVLMSLGLMFGFQNTNKTHLEKDYFIVNLVYTIFIVIAYVYLFSKKVIYNKMKVVLNEIKSNDKLPRDLTILIEYAKSDLLKFQTHFQTLYPKIISNLKKNNPSLTTKDIYFCLYIFLDFTSKEIATYLGITYKSVQNKKYLLKFRSLKST